MTLDETKKVLRDFTVSELTQMQMGLRMKEKVLLSSFAYTKALEVDLIEKDGTPHDLDILCIAVDHALSFWSILWKTLRGKG